MPDKMAKLKAKKIMKDKRKYSFGNKYHCKLSFNNANINLSACMLYYNVDR